MIALRHIGVFAALLAKVAFADAQYFVAPDRFEIEVVSGTPIVRVTRSVEGPVARFTLVPAYDVGIAAVEYHQRAYRDEIEVSRLSLDVLDIELTNRTLKQAITVQRIEKERDRDRIGVRIAFSKDLSREQVRLLFGSTAVYGTVKGRLLCPEGVPENICDWKTREVPAFNQFQSDGSDESDARVALASYTVLSRYKAEVLARASAKIERGEDLDRWVKGTLALHGTCAPDLAPYPAWICRHLFEASKDGSLTEALFLLSKRAFPRPEVEHDYTAFLFDAAGDRVRSLADPPLAPAAGRRSVVETPPVPGPEAPVFERLLARWGKGAIDSTVYREWMRRYVKWIFWDAKDKDVDAITETLMRFRRYEDDTKATKTLVTIAIREHEQTHEEWGAQRRDDYRRALVDGVPEAPYFDYLIGYCNGLGYEEPRRSGYAEESWRNYLKHYHKKLSEEEQAKLAKRYSRMRSITGDPDFNREKIRALFFELERSAKGPPPEERK